MAKRFVVPFATSGDKSVTPDATDPAGAISYSQGWPVAYQLADTDPNYRPVGRQEMNGVLFDVTGALAELQTLGFPEWVAVTGLVTPYAINATVRHNSNNWRSTVANNSVEPGTDATWVLANEAPPLLTTAGTAPNFTLTPSPAISGYAAGQPFRVKFSATPVGVPTLNVSAKGAKNLKQYDAAGTKIQAVIVADQIADVVYDGVDVVILDPLPPAVQASNLVGSTGVARNWKASATGTNSTVTATADSVTVRDASDSFKTLFSLSLNASLTASGASGLDAGVVAVSTWYHYYVIWNPTTDARSLIFSLSAVAPLLPAGYTHFARSGAIRSDANASNKFPIKFTQSGNKTSYAPATGANLTAAIAAASGSATFPTLVSLATVVPSTACSAILRLSKDATTGTASVSPNQTASCSVSFSWATVNLGAIVQQVIIGLEQIGVYWGSTANSILYCDGWEDNL